jgi:hypothetical protein
MSLNWFYQHECQRLVACAVTHIPHLANRMLSHCNVPNIWPLKYEHNFRFHKRNLDSLYIILRQLLFITKKSWCSQGIKVGVVSLGPPPKKNWLPTFCRLHMWKCHRICYATTLHHKITKLHSNCASRYVASILCLNNSKFLKLLRKNEHFTFYYINLPLKSPNPSFNPAKRKIWRD